MVLKVLCYYLLFGLWTLFTSYSTGFFSVSCFFVRESTDSPFSLLVSMPTLWRKKCLNLSFTIFCKPSQQSKIRRWKQVTFKKIILNYWTWWNEDNCSQLAAGNFCCIFLITSTSLENVSWTGLSKNSVSTWRLKYSNTLSMINEMLINWLQRFNLISWPVPRK